MILDPNLKYHREWITMGTLNKPKSGGSKRKRSTADEQGQTEEKHRANTTMSTANTNLETSGKRKENSSMNWEKKPKYLSNIIVM